MTWLQRLGDGMRRHGRLIRTVQWLVVLVYAVLLVLPALLPLPSSQARLVNNLTLLAQFIFWGLWWPFVLLSMVLFGRLWCGVLCPEGSLSEWASQHGRGLGIPRWVRWGGWPTLGFCLTTLILSSCDADFVPPAEAKACVRVSGSFMSMTPCLFTLP